MSRPRSRVAAYVVRASRRGPELLVFDHVGLPEAGTQVPAGGLRAGEPPDLGVLREVTEETGLRGATVVRRVAVDVSPHPATGQPRRTVFLLLTAPTGTPDSWRHRVTGADGDRGLVFACRFTALPLAHPLADHQDRWLGEVSSRWVTGSGGPVRE